MENIREILLNAYGQREFDAELKTVMIASLLMGVIFTSLMVYVITQPENINTVYKNAILLSIVILSPLYSVWSYRQLNRKKIKKDRELKYQAQIDVCLNIFMVVVIFMFIYMNINNW